MDTIATVTLNPAVDLSTGVPSVVPDRKLRCAPPRRDPGGGGINVARAAHRLGAPATAVYLAGGATGDLLHHLLEEEGVPRHRIAIEGWTRENVIIREEGSGQLYRFGMPGPEVRDREWRRCLDAIAALDPAPGYIVASGSLPPGVPAGFHARLADIARGLHARLVVDTSGEALREAVAAGVFLIKPNVREFQELVGRELADEEHQNEAARRIVDEGGARVVVISLGAGGALLVTAEDDVFVRTPTVPQRSKVGAGDSMVAGIVAALARGAEPEEAVRFGVAAGAAAVMTEGTELCGREDTERLYREISREPTERPS